MSPTTALAIAFHVSMATKLTLAAVLVVVFFGVKWFATKRSGSDATVPGPGAEPSLPDHTVDRLGEWMEHWRHLAEEAIAAGDARQLELLNLMMSAKTEECLSHHEAPLPE